MTASPRAASIVMQRGGRGIMTRTNLLAQLLRALRVAHYAEQHNVGTAEAQERLAELAHREALFRRDRRDFLKIAAGGAGETAGAMGFKQIERGERQPRDEEKGGGGGGEE